MTKIESVEVVLPEWAQGRSLDEMGFCHDFLLLYPLVYVDGVFYSKDGRLAEEKVRKMVFDYLSSFVRTGLSKKLNGLMEVLKLQSRREEKKPSETILHFPNGTYDLNRDLFTPEKTFSRFRMPVNYNANAPEPRLWLRFLEELLEPEDILTLQEFMGYCLVPVNYAQKMLLIIGNGGEGKSRIGIILRALLGENMSNGSLAKVEASPFARADLQGRLLMVDDDLRLEALTSTNYIKSIVTAEQPMDLEKKGVQSYQGMLYCRFLAFGNGNLRSLHDRSYGFFRRQIILTTKERRPDRVDDPYLAQRLKLNELEGILQWCIQGLRRLAENNLQFTISPQAQANMRSAIAEGNNILDFMESEGYFRLCREGEISSRSFYSLYKDWCDDNILPPLSAKSFSAWLMQNGSKYNISYTNRIHGGNGRKVRGFRGVSRLQGWT